jgi:hypothetical protein
VAKLNKLYTLVPKQRLAQRDDMNPRRTSGAKWPYKPPGLQRPPRVPLNRCTGECPDSKLEALLPRHCVPPYHVQTRMTPVSLVLTEVSVSIGSCRVPSGQWDGMVWCCVCLCWATSSFGECGVLVGVCLCWGCVAVVGWRDDVMA